MQWFTFCFSLSLSRWHRKKLMTTAQYVYQVMFKEEHKSDVAVRCLGRTWHLHKVYLCQSAYFSSMFGGSWKESDRDFINIEIIDPNISIEGKFCIMPVYTLSD